MDDQIRKHIDEYHAFKKADLEGMVKEHKAIVEWIEEARPIIKETNRNTQLIVDDFYGEKHPTAADPDRRQGGLAATLARIEDTVDGVVKSGVTTRREWTNGQWTLAAAVLAAIIAAVTQLYIGG